MAKLQLKPVLRPGERLLGRTPLIWVPWMALETLLMIALSIALLWAMRIVTLDDSGLRVVLVPVIYFGGIALPILAGSLCSTAVVTNQRVLERDLNTWSYDRAIDMTSVEAVESSRDTVRVGLPDGEIQVYHFPNRARTLCAMLAKAAGVACTPPPSRREVWAGKLYRFCTVFVSLGLILGFSKWAHTEFDEGLAYFLTFNICLLFSRVGGIPGGWLAIALLRRTISYRETRHWITAFDRTSLLIGNDRGRGLGMIGRTQLWFAKQLY
ncbi:MAG: hypothetical protein AAF495_22385 [Pseudomonadota bacterium]